MGNLPPSPTRKHSKQQPALSKPPITSFDSGAPEVVAHLRPMFRSKAFNRIDSLDAYAGDFQSFREMDPMLAALVRPCAGPPSPTETPEPSNAGTLESVPAPHPENRPVHDPPARQLTRSAQMCLRAHSCECRRCNDACCFGALRIATSGIEIDRSLCSTCGLCELACPTGALRLPFPDLAQVLHDALTRHEAAVGIAPTVVVCEAAPEVGSGKPGESALFVQTPSVGRIGAEVLIAAVAWGAARVFVRLIPGSPPAIRAALRGQMEAATAILEGLGHPPERLAIIEEGADLPATETTIQGVVPARFEPPENKRDLLRSAVYHLCVQGRSADGSAALGPGAHYGEITVAARSCSFCLACAGACPTGAISGTDDHPGIRFLEVLCVQCGRCAAVCPERALSLRPRLAFDRSTVESPRVLAEENSAFCIVCGVPFASPGMIARVSAKLENHWMYRRPEHIRRLQMCAACRVRDLHNLPGGDA